MSYNTGATFVPGGDDSYYMPELAQPTPNRYADQNPSSGPSLNGSRAYELPTNMQHNVAQMEHVASSPNSSAYSGSVYTPQSAEYAPANMNAWSSAVPPSDYHNGYDQRAPSHNPPQSFQQNNYPPRTTSTAQIEQPNFSPFPVLRNPPPNIPPTDEQKEATLEAARAAVLSCNDPDTQLTWAQDALAYVEICQQNEERVALAQTPRSRTPRIEHMLREDALKITNFLADQHHPKAEFMRGMWLEFGKFGHRIDKKEAFLCYSRAAERGYVRADYRIGMQFESSNDALKAIKYYQKGADASDSASCYRLGMMTLLGQHGQPQDYERGLQLIYLAAQTADENAPQGAFVFGMLQAHQMTQVQVPERYLPKDISAAKINIEKAAYLGFAKAQVKMGQAYELGELGCPFDPALSLHYNALAARQGEPEAELAISKWFLCGHEGLFEKNEEMAFTYAQRAALAGFPTAQFAMGYYYEVGIYVPVNFEQAKEWYRKASQSGNQDANGRIDAISRSKTLSRKDHESVALSKIRQQRGSMIGRPQMPMLAEERLDMPDPSRLSLENRKPSPGRPGSTAPYPTGPSNLPHVPDFRPTSGFGSNPNIRPSSTAPLGGLRPDPYGQPHLSPQTRPYSSNDTRVPGPGYGRGDRIPSGPAPSRPGPPPQRPGTASPHIGAQAPPKLDIGYSAPLEQRRPQQPPQPNGYGRPQPPGPGPHGPPRPSPRPGQAPPQSQGPPQNRPAPQNARPGYGNPPQNIRPANMPPSKPAANAPSGNAPPSKPNQVSANAARPPGKGPKTFDEMGVPAGKDKGECIVM
ncbi:hypothetical protein PV08_10210 [Exophiala spinifera]|uniref:Chitin synthase activator (Chs3) n=1 Tax=Exophiala spinifera TaxID=91928 RepID=A0A0D1Y7L8_9EURO|nr:uncharacterized protein PV08_10210 [Exophiala spinifera]KIW10911.1 hypothetical protein PV08_10210 [Exophiala spinifera]